MRQRQLVYKARQQVTEITCDLCGESCRVNNFENDDSLSPFCFGTLEFFGSYGSPYDTDTVEMEFCGDCVMALKRKATRNILRRFAKKLCDPITTDFISSGLQDFLGLTPRAFAAVLGVPADEFAACDTADAKYRAQLNDVGTKLLRAMAYWRSEDNLRAWLFSDNAELACVPIEMLQTDKRQFVWDHMEQMFKSAPY